MRPQEHDLVGMLAASDLGERVATFTGALDIVFGDGASMRTRFPWPTNR